MANYIRATRRSLAKKAALAIALNKHLNPLVIAATRLFAPPEIQRRMPVLNRTTDLSTVDGKPKVTLLNLDKCQVAKEVFWSGGKLASNADRMAISLAVVLAGDADVFLDIGSYTGVFAIAVAKANPHVHAHAYEILPENFLYLWQNVFANDVVANVHPHLCGIGELNAHLTAPTTFGAGQLPSGIGIDLDLGEGTRVPIKPLDQLFPGFSGRMVWKIDVERFELGVFRGAQKLIESASPDIICEVLHDAPNVDDLDKLISDLGYYKYQITDNGLARSNSIRPSAQYKDWLFTTRSAEDLMTLGFVVPSTAS